MTTPLRSLEGKYELLGKLHEGGMGAIYRVRHRLLEEIRVVKVLHPHFADDQSFQDRFVQEARAAVRVRHPNIAQLYDFSIDDEGTAFMVMEHIQGRNLAEVLSIEKPLPPDLVAEIGIQALSALGYLHRKHFVHRDIAPDNLMLTRDELDEPCVKLIDLGIVKALKEDTGITQAGMFVGKVRYASPEHFGGSDGRTVVEPRSDLYSLGVVLYELATGWVPIRGKEYSSILAGHLFQPPMGFDETDPDNRVPPLLRESILKALEKSADDRHPTADLFVRSLRAVVEGTASDLGMAWDRISRRLDEQLAPGEREEGSTQGHLDQEFPRSDAAAIALADLGEVGGTLIARPLDETRERFERLLESEQIDEAGVMLDTAERNFGTTAITDLRDELARARARIEAAPRIEQLQQEAHDLVGEQRLPEALARLEEAHELDPEDAGVRELLRQTRDVWEQDQRRERSRQRFEEAREALAAGDAQIALDRLEEAVELDPENGPAAALREEVAGSIENERRQHELAGSVRESLRLAELSLSQKSLGVTRSNLELAREQLARLDDPSPFVGRTTAIESGILREELVRAAIAAVEQHLHEGEIDEARAALLDAEQQIADPNETADLRRQVGQSWLSRARNELLAGHYDAATEALDEALEIAPGLAGASRLREQIGENRQAAEEARELQEFSEAMLAIDRDLRGGELDRAGERIESAQEQFGERPEIAAAHARLIEEAVKAAERRRHREQAALVKQVDELVRAGNLESAVRRLEGFDPDTLEATRVVQIRTEICDQLLSTASNSSESRSFGEAERLLETTRRLSPTPHAVEPLLKAVREARRRHEADAIRQRKAEEARRALEQRLAEQDFEGADFVLSLAEKQIGRGPYFAPLRELVEEARERGEASLRERLAALEQATLQATASGGVADLERVAARLDKARRKLGEEPELARLSRELAEGFVRLARDFLAGGDHEAGLEGLQRARELTASTGGIDALIAAAERSRDEIAQRAPAPKKTRKTRGTTDFDPGQLLAETLEASSATVPEKKTRTQPDPESLLAATLDDDEITQRLLRKTRPKGS